MKTKALYIVTNITFGGNAEVLAVLDSFMSASMCKRLAGVNAEVHQAEMNVMSPGIEREFKEIYSHMPNDDELNDQGVFAVAALSNDRVWSFGVYSTKSFAKRVSVVAGFGAQVFAVPGLNIIPKGLLEYGAALGILECR